MEEPGVVKIFMREREYYRNFVKLASGVLQKRNCRRSYVWIFFTVLFLIGVICSIVAKYEMPGAMYFILTFSAASMVLLLAYVSCCTRSAKPCWRWFHLPILEWCTKYRRRGIFCWYAFAFLVYIVFPGLFLYKNNQLVVTGILWVSAICMVIGIIVLTIFLLLANHLHHRGRGDPYFLHRSLQPLLSCCCSSYISLEKYLPKRATENPEPFAHYIANVEDEVPNQDVGIAVPCVSDYLEIQMEGFENPPIQGLEEVPEEVLEELSEEILLEVMVEISAGVCFELIRLYKRSLTSYPFSNEASNSDLLSTKTDSIPYSFTSGSSTSSQVTVLSAGSQSDIDDPFSDENPQQGTSERLGGEQACSACGTSEEASQLEQDIVAGQKTTSACQSAEEIASPRQVEKAEMVESSEEVPK